MLSQPTTAETAAPTTMASISPAGTSSKAASALLRRPAPRSRVAKHEGEPRGLLSRESTRHRRRNGDAGARPAGHQRDRLSAAHPSGVGSVSATKLTATARKLACLIYRLIKAGQGYQEGDARTYELKYKDQILRALRKRAAGFGFELVEVSKAA